MTPDEATISEIIAMAWCDKTAFDDITAVMGVSEQETMNIMRQNLKPSSYRLWRKRVVGRGAKHKKKNRGDLELDQGTDSN